MKTVTVYPSRKDYSHFFAHMGTSHLKVWIEVALRKLPQYKGAEQLCVLRALIQARKELITRQGG